MGLYISLDDGVGASVMYGLGLVRLDLLPSCTARPPKCVLCDLFLVGRCIFEGVTTGPEEFKVFEVEEWEEVVAELESESLAISKR